MSVQAWDKEYEDRGSTEPAYSIASSYNFDVDADLKASARAQELDLGRQEGSEYSDVAPNCFRSDVPHVVPWKLIVSLAFPPQLSHRVKYTKLIEKYRKHPRLETSAVRAYRFCHIEYHLLPDDTEPKKVDVVIFPAMAKVFLESGVKIVKLWEEGDRVWVSWTQTFNINVTKELLKKMCAHKITLKLWNTKDRVPKKIRYGLKTAGSLDDVASVEEVRRLVLSQRSLSELGLEKANSIKTEWDQEESVEKPDKAEKQDKMEKPDKAEKHSKQPYPHRHNSRQTDTETSPKSSEEQEKSAPRGNNSKVQTTPLAEATMLEINDIIERSSFSNLDRQKSQAKGKDSEGQKKSPKRKTHPGVEEEGSRKLLGPWRQSAFSLQLAVMPLLAGRQTVMSRSSEKSAHILDCLLTLRAEVPLMTEEQKQDLNPLIIKIECASCLPAQPVPIHELEDINVVFLGGMHPGDLREYLEGPPMVVEVHDRDRKSEDYLQKPSVFGEDPLDMFLNLPAVISPKETEANPLKSRHKLWDPYGVAQVSFADLLLGHRFLDLDVPIHSCEPKLIDPMEDSSLRKVGGFRVPKDGLHRGPMPMGNYLDAGSQLKLRVDITVPLRAGTADPDLQGSQFGRIVILFDHRKTLLLHSVLQDITVINAQALELGSCPIRNTQQILSTFRMRVKIQEQQQLNVLTGFHLLDGELHLFVLEGLADQGLRQLWENLQHLIPETEKGRHKVLYNSKLRFRCRLYGDLDTLLCRVHLFKPMSQLMRQAALYLRRQVPRSVFRALARIYDICYNSTRLRDVIVGDLLPSSAMIRDLSQEFGIPITQEGFSEEALLATPPQPSPNLEHFRNRTSTLSTEIHAHQRKYLQWRNAVLLQKEGHKLSLIQKNIQEVHQAGKRPPKSAVKVIRISAPANHAVYNYSTQTLNSTQLAKKELYKEMAKEPGRRFTYSQNYLSAMVEPQDSEEEKKQAEQRSRQAWLTAGGFQVTGLQSGPAGQSESLRLPPIRELDEEWMECALFANVLKPVLDRDRWSWDQRHLDFDLYKKPPPFFQLPPPVALEPATGRR
ncbi:uncharacterized protein CFAP92 isoform X2 [Ochotona princeps]|uniref:uncharacterized protein CFAP92 isoform X2 n=1 Tax=Ochotona princeps TaxID=9978 RepID=UPI002714A80C|nr:uncharacterized protein CFAP92 isoform X2 [Ochotona princeps]